jgi:hypothetical protein
MKPRERGEPLPPSLVLSGRRLIWPLVVAVALVAWAGGVGAADLVIRIPGDLSQQDGFYRLDYRDVNNRKIKILSRSFSTGRALVCRLQMFRIAINKLFEWSARLPALKLGFDSRPGHVSPETSSLERR